MCIYSTCSSPKLRIGCRFFLRILEFLQKPYIAKIVGQLPATTKKGGHLELIYYSWILNIAFIYILTLN